MLPPTRPSVDAHQAAERCSIERSLPEDERPHELVEAVARSFAIEGRELFARRGAVRGARPASQPEHQPALGEVMQHAAHQLRIVAMEALEYLCPADESSVAQVLQHRFRERPGLLPARAARERHPPWRAEPRAP
ncbi:MAG TPA: hypothetical protein VH062_32730 [Polyangiaceae bacterium]|nr:hypothetical protein [Polyangiaceae bacterium]